MSAYLTLRQENRRSPIFAKRCEARAHLEAPVSSNTRRNPKSLVYSDWVIRLCPPGVLQVYVHLIRAAVDDVHSVDGAVMPSLFEGLRDKGKIAGLEFLDGVPDSDTSCSDADMGRVEGLEVGLWVTVVDGLVGLLTDAARLVLRFGILGRHGLSLIE